MLVMPANANLITNGSFKVGTFVNDGNATMILGVGSTSIKGWTVVTDQLAWIGAGNPWGLAAQDGNRFLDLTAYPAGAPFGGISQTIATAPGQRYNLSLYLGAYTARLGGPPVSLLAQAGGTSQTFTVGTTSTASTWTPFSMVFTATLPNTAITFTGSAGFQYIGADTVSVEAVGAAAIPEPGTDVWLKIRSLSKPKQGRTAGQNRTPRPACDHVSRAAPEGCGSAAPAGC